MHHIPVFWGSYNTWRRDEIIVLLQEKRIPFLEEAFKV
jgi:hypothetical protein